MFPVLNIGPLAIQTPGLLVLIGLWLGLNLSEKTAQIHHVNPNDLYNLVFSTLIGAIISARLVFIAIYPSAFLESPLSVFSLSPELLDTWGGVAGGIVVGLSVIQRRKYRLLFILDALVPALAVMAVFIDLSNFASGNAFGTQTTMPWGISLWGSTRHPTQLYQAFFDGIILFILWFKRDQFRNQPAGIYFLIFMASSSMSRLILEYFRGDSVLLPGGYHAAQIGAWLVLVVSLWGIRKLIKGETVELED